jgi:catechol 2,3-dioxygenase-like lactoylglutathione lyase family enzyme
MRVSHVILRVTDLDASVAFYRDLVGLELMSETPGFVFFDSGSIQIALNANPDEPTDETSTELVLEVDDVSSTVKEMEDRGIEFEVPLRPVTTAGDRTLHATHLRDPDGHFWSVTGWV